MFTKEKWKKVADQKYITFSKPERNKVDLNYNQVIMRPSFKSLEGANLKYLDEKPKIKKYKIKNINHYIIGD